MLSAFDGHTRTVRMLLDNKARIDTRDSMGRTALMYASSGPNPETVQLLLERKADPNLSDNAEKFTSLMFAAAEGQVRVVEILLAHGADPTKKDADGETALDFARQNGHTAVIRLLNSHLP
jgi:ankyrin repeat protein